MMNTPLADTMVHNAMWDAIVEEIDTNMRLGANQSMEPLALGDLIRLYVVLTILNVMRKETGDNRKRAGKQ